MSKIIVITYLMSNILFATIINVPADYSTIQAGVDAASDGDSILVSAGLYVETLTIGKSLSLIGADADDCEIYEVSYEQDVVWEYDYPGNNNTMIARAQKYSPDYFSELILGDLNNDDFINVLDVVILVNMILGN